MRATKGCRRGWCMRPCRRVLVSMALCVLAGAAASAGPVYVESFGSHGSGDGQFSWPNGLSVDAAGGVYVADRINHRIQKLALSGGSLSHEWSYGSLGNGAGQFWEPIGLAADAVGNVYVVDMFNHRIQKLAPSGGSVVHEWSFGSLGDGAGQFWGPCGVAVDSAGNVYVADTFNHRIQKLTPSGGSVVHEWTSGSGGAGDGQFDHPRRVQLGPGGSVYVADNNNHRIQKLSVSAGGLSHEWTTGGFGYGDGQFRYPWDVAVDSVGNLYVADVHNDRIQRWFDSDALPAGQTATFAGLTVWSDASLGSSLTLDSGKAIQVIGTTTIEDGATLALAAATLDTGRLVIAAGGVLNVEGTVSGAVECQEGGEINIVGDATLGDAGRYDGFDYAGALSVGSHTVTLHAKGFVRLGGIVTELGGGRLIVPNGIALGVGKDLSGTGAVNAKVSAGFGSTIEAAGGDLALGSADAYDGFYSDGLLLTGSNAVTIQDRNEAVLGSLTELGDGAAGGTLTAGNATPDDTHAHFLLEQGKNMVGRGSVNGHYKNHGHVIGDGTSGDERIVFNAPWIVSGKGTFTNTLILGTFAPSESFGITPGENQGFGGTVQIELGGTEPGFGDDNHDQINDTGTILLDGEPTLEILPWNGFVPAVGDEFVILTWQEGLDGEFADVVTDPWFADHGISFDLYYRNVGGTGDLTIEAIPEPATLALLAVGAMVLLRGRRKAARGLSVLLVVGCGVMANAATPGFQGLGELPGGLTFSCADAVSGDGAVVVGASQTTPDKKAFRWTPAERMVCLGDLGGDHVSFAVGASRDGAVVVGMSDSPAGYQAYRWTQAGGMVGLGDLAGAGFYSQAEAVSADGLVVVGTGTSASGEEVFRWTAATGMVGLGDLAGGSFLSRAYGISSDGTTIVGVSSSANGYEAFRWKQATGMVGLGDLSGDGFYSRAEDTSSDGSIMVGQSDSGIGREAFLWREGVGMMGLGDLPGGSYYSSAIGVSAGGSIVVGLGSSASGDEAFIWDEPRGMRNLREVLTEQCHLDVTGWTLKYATDVSDDGMTIVGYGINPGGDWEAWRAVVPEPATLSLLALGGSAVIRRRRQ